MLKICLVFWKSEPQYAYKRYAYKKNMYILHCSQVLSHRLKNANTEIKSYKSTIMLRFDCTKSVAELSY